MGTKNKSGGGINGKRVGRGGRIVIIIIIVTIVVRVVFQL